MWDFLPDEILLIIFKYLQDADLNNASLCCKRWRRVYKAPCLWRSRTFELRGYCRSQEKRIEMLNKYVSSLGEYLEEIKMVCPTPNLLTARGLSSCVNVLLTGLTSLNEGKKKIKSFRMCQLYFQDSWSYFCFSTCFLVVSIANFLQTQTRLRHFDMTDAYITTPFSNQIINALAKSKSARRLQVLRLVNYYDSKVTFREINWQLKVLIKNCCRLKEVSLNYAYLFSVGVVGLCESLSETLDKLTICATIVDFSEPSLYVIDSEKWAMARVACPKLQIQFDIQGWPVNPTTILVPQMPITCLSITSGQCPGSTLATGDKARILLNHVALHFNRTLQSAYIYTESPGIGLHSPINDALIYFIMTCKRLKRLSVSENLVAVDTISKVKEAFGNGKVLSLL